MIERMILKNYINKYDNILSHAYCSNLIEKFSYEQTRMKRYKANEEVKNEY